ncbi:MAG: hypothetical protein RDU01_11725 [Thermodesulfovibrionales bacterium]|nr:hypothetical protein [Thermodesulfovibrionales bacterium]
MKSLIRNINIGNIILAAVVAFFIFSDVSPLFTVQAHSVLPSAKKQEQEIVGEAQEIETPSPAEFMSVAEQNLFHPERKIPVEKKAEQPLPKPEFVLYGTMITDGLSLAYVEDMKAPRSSPGRGKRQTSLKKGDRISGFTLKEIHSDKIVLMRGDEKLAVSIQDPSYPKARTESGVPQSTAEALPASASKPAVQRQAPQSPPQRAFQPNSTSPLSQQEKPERPGRRRGSQKTYAPQVLSR